ncbi:hypothetical protein TSAR_011144 [Trichomalopsis sarcophagae]|uniref:Uncharacterized protein n=1 Tax=Trichomalopsis sarcophagae TaxID=543379 RepID=A0A232FGR0_9HYME|nr:hypothetical protein TSAR_011144 [Trichomalopsis sarcophagae]
MKRLFVFLIVLVAGSRADKRHDYGQKMSQCLIENGLNETHLKYVFRIGKVNLEIPSDVSEEALACMLACVYNFTITMGETQKTLDEVILDVINLDDMFNNDENKRKALKETLDKCKTEAAGDNCKLLQCLKVTRDPFDKIITTGRYNYGYLRRDNE